MNEPKIPNPQGFEQSPAAQPFDARMLESLVCPVSQTSLAYDAGAQELISRTAGLAFPIRDGIPIMLVSEARRLG